MIAKNTWFDIYKCVGQAITFKVEGGDFDLCRDSVEFDKILYYVHYHLVDCNNCVSLCFVCQLSVVIWCWNPGELDWISIAT